MYSSFGDKFRHLISGDRYEDQKDDQYAGLVQVIFEDCDHATTGYAIAAYSVQRLVFILGAPRRAGVGAILVGASDFNGYNVIIGAEEQVFCGYTNRLNIKCCIRF